MVTPLNQSKPLLGLTKNQCRYARACGLPPLLAEDRIRRSLEKIFQFNVQNYKNGTQGAVNGMRPNGDIDRSSLQVQAHLLLPKKTNPLPFARLPQSMEVWTGTTYGVAAAMIGEGLLTQGFCTAEGIYNGCYHELGYWFQTPEVYP